MSNPLVKLTEQEALTELEELILAEAQEDETAYDMQPGRIKIAPGGIGQFQLGDDTVKSFTAIVAVSQKIRAYWPTRGTGNPPICSSADGLVGVFAQDPEKDMVEAAMVPDRPHPAAIQILANEPVQEAYQCSRCPMNQWGSADVGRGKACKEMRRLLVIPEGWTLPALMSLPPTSVKGWDEFCSALASKKSAYFAVRTKFALDSGKAASGETYNIARMSVEGPLELDELQAVTQIRKQYKELVVSLRIEIDEYDSSESADDTPF